MFSKTKIQLTLLLLASSTISTEALATCSHTTQVTNDSGIVLRIEKLKSSIDGVGIFKTQWTGLKTIQPGGTKTIKWTSDYSCIDSGTGQPNLWDVKLIRANGNKHYCGNLSQSEPVDIDTPDLCNP